ncbi:hypothetical protein BTA51_00975 [Hahella sp. CCB-MM4]|uniref:DUF4870 family protein n=1 Tax=Hahella sp. (strain CCB-MM4) TaxID=1926491 RepID=UPI000B9A30EB|nr:DUF4870 domain-containing protein [Hahella sp. CCB-MM4]OZG75005.1 hypothetical protein BTA51_00975 [Hahella sp. CCB-MM4]
MTESTEQAANTSSDGMAKAIYILYLVSIIFGLTSIVGLVMAYIYKGDAPEWLQTHYRYQIRTFWIGFLYGIIGVVLSFIIIGYLVLLFVLVWLIVRCVKGIKALDQKQPVSDPASWMF